MRFLFDCEDEIALPAAYGMLDRLSGYLNKIKDVDVDKDTATTRRAALKAVLQNAMVKYPKETSDILSRLWVLDDGEKAPNAFVTMTALFANEVAINFFTSVLPSVLSISNAISPKSK